MRTNNLSSVVQYKEELCQTHHFLIFSLILGAVTLVVLLLGRIFPWEVNFQDSVGTVPELFYVVGIVIVSILAAFVGLAMLQALIFMLISLISGLKKVTCPHCGQVFRSCRSRYISIDPSLSLFAVFSPCCNGFLARTRPIGDVPNGPIVSDGS